MDFSPLYNLSPLEIFRIVADEFDDIPDDVVIKKMLFASVFIDKEIYGEAANVALALMTAHMMALPGAIGGHQYSTSSSRVTSMKEGDLAISYGSLIGDASWLGQSTYGSLLDMLHLRTGLKLGMITRGPVGSCACEWSTGEFYGSQYQGQ